MCASSRTTHCNLLREARRIGASAVRTSMYSSIVALVTKFSMGGTLFRSVARSRTSLPTTASDAGSVSGVMPL